MERRVRMFALAFASLIAASGTAADPGTVCMGCHLMRPQLDSLRAGSHGKVTSCPDCHEPHDSAAHRLYAVASDGLRHLFLTSLNAAPARIRIHRAGAEVVQANCIRCHGVAENRTVQVNPTVPRPMPQPKTSAHVHSGQMCADCHGTTSHSAWFQQVGQKSPVP
ncbi:MAG: NapC/NirT family cytochrome c [Holophaga sp.]